jgi:hypothetical protein
MDIHKMKKTELLERCKSLGLVNCKSKNKTELIRMIESKEVENRVENHVVNEVKEEPVPRQETINLVSLLNTLIDKYGVKTLSDKLNLAPGTLVRWNELNDVPKNYEFDLLKLSGIKIDYSKYSSKQKDQFFTPVDTAKQCFEIFCNEIRAFGENETDFRYIEPSAGDGSFLKVLPQNTIAMDIEPKHATVIVQDYLDWKPNVKDRYVVFGNPPFGLRGHMALKFINHSSEFAEYVCFILPQLFESDGKGVPRKRVNGFHLIHSMKIESHFYEPNNNTLKINTIFQIWSKNHTNEKYDIKEYTNDNMKIYSMSDGGTVSTTRNKNMIGKCDVYIPSTCFGKENMKCYFKFEDLPGKKGYGIVFEKDKENMVKKMGSIKWNEIAFLSTNSAYNLRSSQIYSLFDT